MQCAACRAVYSNALDACPRCRKPVSQTAPASEKRAAAAQPRSETRAAASGAQSSSSMSGETATATATQATAASTLIEFPGAGRAAARPQWRKDLSERVREIQQRRAREAALEREAQQQQQQLEMAEQAAASIESTDFGEIDETPAPPLGLVPPCADAPPINPLVAAALRRIDRARQPTPSASSSKSRSSNGAATAAAIAYAPEENYRPDAETPPLVAPPPAPPPVRTVARNAPLSETKNSPEAIKAEQANIKTETASETAARTSGLVVVPSPASASALKVEPVGVSSSTEALPPPIAATVETQPPVVSKAQTVETPAPEASGRPKSRRVLTGAASGTLTERREMEIIDAANCVPVVEAGYSDRAHFVRRVVASITDLVVVVLLSVPFATIIELTSGHWTDPRVAASMCGILALVMFLYLVVTTGLIGRTLGMRLFDLRAVDARNALVPTTGQSTRRALFYMLSLATFGIGIIYALFDAEGRTAHDHLSGTVVVRE